MELSLTKASAALATRLLSLSIRHILAILSYPLSNSLLVLLSREIVEVEIVEVEIVDVDQTSPPPNEASRSGR